MKITQQTIEILAVYSKHSEQTNSKTQRIYCVHSLLCVVIIIGIFFQNLSIDRISSIYPSHMILNALAYTKTNF